MYLSASQVLISLLSLSAFAVAAPSTAPNSLLTRYAHHYLIPNPLLTLPSDSISINLPEVLNNIQTRLAILQQQIDTTNQEGSIPLAAFGNSAVVEQQIDILIAQKKDILSQEITLYNNLLSSAQSFAQTDADAAAQFGGI